ncbi:MAG: hypothetical protein WCC12_13745 [Anaerolineales bacterium]
MQNKTIGIIATVLTALVCGCTGLFSCIWGVLIASGQPIDVTTNGVTTPQTFSPTIGFVLLCLSLLLVLVPVAVGFFTLRSKPEASSVPISNEPIPPAS